MGHKNPLGKLVHTAVDVLKDPKGTADKVVDQAKGTASLGKLVAGQVTRTAVSTAGAVAERAGVVRGRPAPGPERPEPTSRPDLRPVPEVNEPAHPVQTPAEEPPTAEDVASTTARKSPARKADGGPVKKAPATKTAAKKAPAKKTAAKKAPAKKAPTTKSTAARIEEPTSAPEAVPDRRGAEPATDTQEQALSPNPEEVARKAAAKGAAANEAPAERVAASGTVKKAPAKKTAAKKTAKKAATKKTAGRKTTTKKAAEVAEDRDVSPVGEDETVWSTSTPGDRLPAGRGKRNEADPEVPVTEEDRAAAHEATPAEVAERVEPD